MKINPHISHENYPFQKKMYKQKPLPELALNYNQMPIQLQIKDLQN